MPANKSDNRSPGEKRYPEAHEIRSLLVYTRFMVRRFNANVTDPAELAIGANEISTLVRELDILAVETRKLASLSYSSSLTPVENRPS